MNIEDLFKYGVTPKNGELAGKRFAVSAIRPDGLDVYEWGTQGTLAFFNNGSYDLWREPKTLFEDDSIAPTWGNLKKAVAAAGLGDETMFAVPVIDGFREAQMSKKKLHTVDGKDVMCVIVE